MNVSLTPELEKLIHDKVASGMYSSASEVVREAIRHLHERDLLDQIKLEQLRKEAAREMLREEKEDRREDALV